MKHLAILPEAEAEMLEAASFYGKRQKALRGRFLASVQDAFTRVRINPIIYPLMESDIRRCLTRTFPYGVIFRALDGTIIVVAIMHLHRDPDGWKQRL
jgi:plasmid stabilization system protein ParE